MVIPSMPGFGFSTPLVGGALDDGAGGPRLRRPDAPARLRLVRHPRQRRRRDGRPRARRARTPRASSARTCCSCSRSRPARPARWTASARRSTPRSSTCSGSSQRRRLQPDERHPPADDRRRPRGLAGRGRWPTASCSRTSATAPAWSARAGARAGQPLLADQHLRHGGALPLRGAARRGRARGQPGPDRGRRLQGRLPDDPGLRRARQREHRALVGVPRGRPLRRDGGAGGRRRRPAGVLRRLPGRSVAVVAGAEGGEREEALRADGDDGLDAVRTALVGDGRGRYGLGGVGLLR